MSGEVSNGGKFNRGGGDLDGGELDGTFAATRED